MSRRNVRAGNYASRKGAQARAMRERLSEKQQSQNQTGTPKPTVPADAPKVRNTYQRLIDKIDADRAQTTKEQR